MDWSKAGSKGVIARAQIITLYGQPKVGKTTLASHFPDPAIMDLEDGSAHLANVHRYGAELFPTFAEIQGLMDFLSKGSSNFKTLVIDSMEALEAKLCAMIAKLNNVTSIEDIPYGRGYALVKETITKFMRDLQILRDTKKMNIIIIGHSQVKTFTDPKTNQVYDRYTFRSNDKYASVIQDLSDSILFMQPEVYTEKSKQNPTKSKASSTGDRVIYTRWTHAYNAGTRYDIPEEIIVTEANMKEVVDVIMGKGPSELWDKIMALKAKVKDSATLEKLEANLQAAGKDRAVLEAIYERLVQITK